MDPDGTKVLIFGAGAVGCIYGWILHNAGCNVTFVCRSNYEAIQSKGLSIRSKIFGDVHCNPNATKTVTEAAELEGRFDYILVCSKAFPGTAERIKDAVTPGHTAIILAQNGIGIEEDYASLYPSNTIISGVVWLPTTQTEPGVIEHGPLEKFEIGTFPTAASAGSKDQTARLTELWKVGGATCVLHDDVQPRRWTKLAVNASWNPMTALTLCDDANLLRSSGQSENVIREVMREVGTVATAAGYPSIITNEWIEKDLERPRSRLETGGKEPSMLTDVRHGRPMEVEAILGNVVRMAQALDVEVPRLGMLYVLAKGLGFGMEKGEGWREIARH